MLELTVEGGHAIDSAGSDDVTAPRNFGGNGDDSNIASANEETPDMAWTDGSAEAPIAGSPPTEAPFAQTELDYETEGISNDQSTSIDDYNDSEDPSIQEVGEPNGDDERAGRDDSNRFEPSMSTGGFYASCRADVGCEQMSDDAPMGPSSVASGCSSFTARNLWDCALILVCLTVVQRWRSR